MSLADILGTVGYALDTPGAYTRGLLAGKPGQRASGRDVLRLGPNKPGLDAGDVAGFAAEMALDPLNLLPMAWFGKAAKAAGRATKFNSKVDDLIRAGGMPAELAAVTKAVDETGKPATFLHGTPYVFPVQPDPKMLQPAMYGEGFYTTRDIGLPASGDPQAIGRKGAVTSGIWDDARGAYAKKGYIHKGQEFAPRVHAPISPNVFREVSTEVMQHADRLKKDLQDLHSEMLLRKPPTSRTSLALWPHDVTHMLKSLDNETQVLTSSLAEGSREASEKSLRRLTQQSLAAAHDTDNAGLSQKLSELQNRIKGDFGGAPHNVRLHKLYSEKPFDVTRPGTIEPVLHDTTPFLPYVDKMKLGNHVVGPENQKTMDVASGKLEDIVGDESRLQSAVQDVYRAAPQQRDVMQMSPSQLREARRSSRKDPLPGREVALGKASDAATDLKSILVDAIETSGMSVRIGKDGAATLAKGKGKSSVNFIAGTPGKYSPTTRLPDRMGVKIFRNPKLLDRTSLFRLTEMAESLATVLKPKQAKVGNFIDSLRTIEPLQPGHELWNAIDRDTPASKALFEKLKAEGGLMSNSGILERNDVLRSLGYDTIRHAGGLGGPITHDVAVALKPENVFGPWDVPAKVPVRKLRPKSLAALLAAQNATARNQ